MTCSPSTLADPKVVTVTGEDEMMTLSKKIDAGEATPDDYDPFVALTCGGSMTATSSTW